MNIFEQLEKDRYAENDFVPTPVQHPTETLLGTDERIEVYVRRLEEGVELFHPDDNKNYTTHIRGFKD